MGKKATTKVKTQQVETADDGAVIGTENDKRLAMYNQIADSNDKARAEEFFEADEDGHITEGLTVEASDDEEEEDNEEVIVDNSEENEQEEEEESEEDAPLVASDPNKKGLTSAPAKYKIVVNGVEKEVDENWLVATAQKVESADEYLRNAARLNQEAQQLKNPPKTEEAQPEEMDEVALARAIQMGSEEEAVAAIRKLRSTGPSSDDLARTIDERLNFQTSAAWFQKEYKDIVSDPLLAQLAINQDHMMRAQGDNRPYVERYKEIGDGIRNWVASKAPKVEEKTETETKVDTQATKKARKAAAPSVPKPASAKAAVPEEDDEEESVQDTIANMAKARGGPQWLRS